MKTIGVLIGIAGLVFVVFSPGFGMLGILLGLLFFMVDATEEKRELEGQRYRKILAVTQQNQQVKLSEKSARG